MSDDEDDTHPNVDTASLFRWRHQARLDRMAEHKREKEQFEQSLNEHQRKMAEIKKKLASVQMNDVGFYVDNVHFDVICTIFT